jgi:hypothetical protein
MLAALLLSSAASASTIDITMVGTVSTPLTSNTGATWQTLDGQSLPYSVLQGDDATATVIIDTSIEGGSSQVTADGVWFYIRRIAGNVKRQIGSDHQQRLAALAWSGE